MTLKLEKDISQEIRRVIYDECQKAVDIIKDEKDAHVVVHELRKSFKKIRAALRLVRYQIPFYHEENVFFRGLGRKVTEIRDASAAIEAVDRLTTRYTDKLYNSTFASLRAHLLQRRESIEDEKLKREQLLAQVRNDLEEKVKEIAVWDISAENFDELQKGLKNTYKRGVKALEASQTAGSNADFHEWRKRAKYFRYQIDLLNGVWPKYLRRMEKELHELTDNLGADHDLVTLNTIIEEEEVAFKDITSKNLFFVLLQNEREQLQKKACLKGAKLYADSPSDLINKFEIYWRTYQAEVEDPLLV